MRYLVQQRVPCSSSGYHLTTLNLSLSLSMNALYNSLNARLQPSMPRSSKCLHSQPPGDPESEKMSKKHFIYFHSSNLRMKDWGLYMEHGIAAYDSTCSNWNGFSPWTLKNSREKSISPTHTYPKFATTEFDSHQERGSDLNRIKPWVQELACRNAHQTPQFRQIQQYNERV